MAWNPSKLPLRRREPVSLDSSERSGVIHIMGPDTGPSIATVRWSQNPRATKEDAIAYADYIVRACNSFPALLEACKAICEATPPNRHAGSAELQAYAKLFENARAAIAQAEPEGGAG